MSSSITGKQFVCIPLELLSRADLGHVARELYEHLLNSRNRKTGQCNPKRATLAGKMGISIPTVSRAVGELVAKGLISSRQKSACNEYEIIPPERWLATTKKPRRAAKRRIKNDSPGGSKMIHQEDQKRSTTPSVSLYEPDVLEPDVLEPTPIVPTATAAPAVAQPAVERVADPPLAEASAPTPPAAVATRLTQGTLWEEEPAKVVAIPQRVAHRASPPDPGWFQQWWAIYWRKVSRKDAEKAFAKHVKTEARFEQVMAATRAQAPMMMHREPEHRPHGATWLNAERWEDQPAPPVRKQPERQDRGFMASVSRVIGGRLARGEKPW